MVLFICICSCCPSPPVGNPLPTFGAIASVQTWSYTHSKSLELKSHLMEIPLLHLLDRILYKECVNFLHVGGELIGHRHNFLSCQMASDGGTGRRHVVCQKITVDLHKSSGDEIYHCHVAEPLLGSENSHVEELAIVATGNPDIPIDGVNTIGMLLTSAKANIDAGYLGILTEDEGRDPDYFSLLVSGRDKGLGVGECWSVNVIVY
eukprot:Gb_23299 [translate_table: standard]